MLTLIDISATQYTHINISKLLSMLIILVIFGCFQLKLLQTAPLILNVIITNYSKHLCLLIISDKKTNHVKFWAYRTTYTALRLVHTE